MIKKRPFSPEEFKAIYSRVPRLCVDIVVKTPKGIVLSLRNLPSWNGKWHIPGGTVLNGEKLTDSVHRVASEELGIKVKIKKLLGYVEFPNEAKERGFGHSVSASFLCSTKNLNFKINKDEASRVGVFKELPDGLIEEQYQFLQSVWNEIKK